MVFIRSAYNYDRDEASASAALFCPPEEGKTQQQFKEECDINTIVRRFGLTGKVPVGFKMPQVGDFTAVYDFQSAMNMVVQAQDTFLQVPGEIRARFGHDPQAFMSWLGNPENRAEATKLGFFKEPDLARSE